MHQDDQVTVWKLCGRHMTAVQFVCSLTTSFLPGFRPVPETPLSFCREPA